MSIKRISELPSIEGIGKGSPRAQFLKSFMEVSYLSDDMGQVYASKKVKVQELLDEFRDQYYSKTPITGDVYVNYDKETATYLDSYSNHEGIVYEGQIDFYTTRGLYVHKSDAAAPQPCLVADSISSLQAEPFDDRDVLPKWKVQSMLESLSSDMMNRIRAEIDEAAAGKWPLLTFVFSDHVISDAVDSWVSAGSVV